MISYLQYPGLTRAKFRELLANAESPMLPDSDAIYDILLGNGNIPGLTSLWEAQSWYEAKHETVRSRLTPDDHNPTNMKWWPEDPRGMPAGATGKKPVGNDQGWYLTFKDYPSAVREYRRRVTDDPTYKGGAYKPTMTLAEYLYTYAEPTEIHPDSGKDTWDIYPEVVSRLKLNGAWSDDMAQEYKVMLTDTQHIMVESQIPIVVALLPKSQKNQRPGYYMDAVYWVQHENGNPNHKAANELTYFRNGAEGRQASYHFVGDESVIYQMVPIKENTWQAGDNLGPGNMKSISGSIAQGAKSFTQARQGMAFFAGRLMRKVGIARNNARRHIDFAPNRKNCPQWINDGGLWPTHNAQIQTAWDGGGSIPAPVPTYPKPIQIAALDIAGIAPAMITLEDGTECIYVGDRVRSIRETRRLQWAGSKAPDIGPKIAKGEEFNVDWLLKNSEGWWYYTPYDTRIDYDDVERVSDTKL